MKTEPRRPPGAWLALLPVALIGFLIARALWSLPPETPGLSLVVNENLASSGVRAQVTAILLNFRSYDTLLEIMVLLVALLGTWNLGRLHRPEPEPAPGPVLEALTRVLVPVILIVSGYVLWLGSHSAGGAFQAGALLAAAGVLVFVVRADWLPLRNSTRLRALLVAGPFVFALVAAGLMAAGRLVLQYPTDYAGALILLIEAASTLTIGATLTLLFAGGRPPQGSGK